MYVCKTLFTDASLVNKIVGFHKGRRTIKKKRVKEDIYKKTEKERKKKKINSMHIACNWKLSLITKLILFFR